MPTERALGAHREYTRQPDGSWRVDPWDGRSINDKVEALTGFLGLSLTGPHLSTEAALTSIAITLRQLVNAQLYKEHEAIQKAAIMAREAPKPLPPDLEDAVKIHIPNRATQREIVEALQYALGGNFRGWDHATRKR